MEGLGKITKQTEFVFWGNECGGCEEALAVIVSFAAVIRVVTQGVLRDDLNNGCEGDYSCYHKA